MRQHSYQYYDKAAKKQTVSLTINSDLYAKAKEAGLNASQVAEDALAEAVVRRLKAQIQAEIEQDIRAYNDYVQKYGSPAELVREWYAAKARGEVDDKEDAV